MSVSIEACSDLRYLHVNDDSNNGFVLPVRFRIDQDRVSFDVVEGAEKWFGLCHLPTSTARRRASSSAVVSSMLSPSSGVET